MIRRGQSIYPCVTKREVRISDKCPEGSQSDGVTNVYVSFRQSERFPAPQMGLEKFNRELQHRIEKHKSSEEGTTIYRGDARKGIVLDVLRPGTYLEG